MLRGGAKVLAHGQHLDRVVAEVVHRLEDFRLRFAEAEHETAFGHGFRPQFFGAAQELEGELVFGPRADDRGEAFDRFEVVIEDVRRCRQHGA